MVNLRNYNNPKSPTVILSNNCIQSSCSIKSRNCETFESRRFQVAHIFYQATRSRSFDYVPAFFDNKKPPIYGYHCSRSVEYHEILIFRKSQLSGCTHSLSSVSHSSRTSDIGGEFIAIKLVHSLRPRAMQTSTFPTLVVCLLYRTWISPS